MYDSSDTELFDLNQYNLSNETSDVPMNDPLHVEPTRVQSKLQRSLSQDTLNMEYQMSKLDFNDHSSPKKKLDFHAACQSQQIPQTAHEAASLDSDRHANKNNYFSPLLDSDGRRQCLNMRESYSPIMCENNMPSSNFANQRPQTSSQQPQPYEFPPPMRPSFVPNMSNFAGPYNAFNFHWSSPKMHEAPIRPINPIMTPNYGFASRSRVPPVPLLNEENGHNWNERYVHHRSTPRPGIYHAARFFNRYPPKQMNKRRYCAFCKKNGEMFSYYTSHHTKTDEGKVLCPVLRAYTCDICSATGDYAHTRSHCPLNKNMPRADFPKFRRLSNGMWTSNFSRK